MFQRLVAASNPKNVRALCAAAPFCAANSARRFNHAPNDEFVVVKRHVCPELARVTHE
jgi:hypothetical protein